MSREMLHRTVKPSHWCTVISANCTTPALVRNMNQPGVSLDKSTAHAEDKGEILTVKCSHIHFLTGSNVQGFHLRDWAMLEPLQLIRVMQRQNEAALILLFFIYFVV